MSTTFFIKFNINRNLTSANERINTRAEKLNPNIQFELSGGTTVEFRKSGDSSNQCLSLVSKKSDGTAQYHDFISSSGDFLPFYAKILNIEPIVFSGTETIANLKSQTITAKYTQITGADGYLIIPIKCNYGIVTTSAYSNGTITLTVMNVSGETHTMSGSVCVVPYRNKTK